MINLRFSLCPEPQETLQGDHGVHSERTQSTGKLPGSGVVNSAVVLAVDEDS